MFGWTFDLEVAGAWADLVTGVANVVLIVMTLAAVRAAVVSNELTRAERRGVQARESLERAYVPIRRRLRAMREPDPPFPPFEEVGRLSDLKDEPVLLPRLGELRPLLEEIDKLVP